MIYSMLYILLGGCAVEVGTSTNTVSIQER